MRKSSGLGQWSHFRFHRGKSQGGRGSERQQTEETDERQ